MIDNTIGKCSRCGLITAHNDPRMGTSCDQRIVMDFKNPKTGLPDQKFVRCEGVIIRHVKK